MEYRIHAMRFVPTATILSLVGALVGCGSSTPSTPTADAGAGTDVVTVTDTGNITPTDTPTVTDTGGGGGGSDAAVVNAEVETLVREAAMNNWAIINRGRSMMMYGCAAGARPQDCLARHPARAARTSAPTARPSCRRDLRVLYTATTRSNYWTRGSADGRFIARGIYVHDMSRDVEMPRHRRDVRPGLLPRQQRVHLPAQRAHVPDEHAHRGDAHDGAITGAGSHVHGELGGLYQHLGASSTAPTTGPPPRAPPRGTTAATTATLTETRRNETWTANASATLTLMANTGAGFTVDLGPATSRTPFQGDAVISPSGRA
jgi:hypothetical protein